MYPLLSDRPDPPRFPVCENIRDDSVVLSWKPPLNDGGSFITDYIIEKLEPPQQNWVRCATTRYLEQFIFSGFKIFSHC